LTYCHESWVIIERVLSQAQTAEMGLLRRVHDVTLRDKLRSCEIRVSRMYHGEIGDARPVGYTHGKAAQKSSKDQVE